MDADSLKAIVEKHRLWLNNEGGERADLQRADLQEADLQEADLRWSNLQEADLRWSNLREANLQEANLQEANLQGANLQGANLQWSDLQRANLDFSCWPLWCGSKGVQVDVRIARQLAAHFCVLDCDDPEYQAAKEALLPFARQSHRAKDLGIE